jgi:iron(III) transport system substrate-binding protein
LTAASKNRDEAIALLEYMVSQEAQQWYAEVNNEYPVVDGVKASDVLNAFGTAKSDNVALSKLGELNQEALRLMDRAGWK